jgi:putative DNA primase/helicase
MTYLSNDEMLEEERRHEHAQRADERGWTTIAASDIRPSPVSFLDGGRYPLGAVTAVVGEPGKAKSTLTLDLLARASRGQLPGDLDGPCSALYLSAEDSPEHTLVPRLIGAGADLGRVAFFTVRRDGIDDGMTLPDDLPALRAAVIETGARIVVVDPLMAHMSGKVDSHRDHDVRRVLAPLARLADDFAIAVIVIAHLNKSEASDVFRRVGGSIGLTAAVRSIVVLADDPEAPDDDTARVLLHAKSNLAKLQPTLRLRVEGRDITAGNTTFSTAAITWCGESTVTAADVFGRQHDRPTPSRDTAADMLNDQLAAGPAMVSELKFVARSLDISWRSVERAKGDLGIIAEQVRDESGRRVTGWSWRLPPTPPPPKDPPGGGLENDPTGVAAEPPDGSGDLYTATSPPGTRDVADLATVEFTPDDAAALFAIEFDATIEKETR